MRENCPPQGNYLHSPKILITLCPLVVINVDYYELENNLSWLAEPQLNKCINSHDLSLTYVTSRLCLECRRIHTFEMQETEKNIKLKMFKSLDPIQLRY